MNIMYVDESGDDGFSGNNTYSPGLTPTKYFLRTGLVVHDWKWTKINSKIEGFRVSKGIPKCEEIHATEIFGGKKKIHVNGKRKTVNNWFGKNFPKKQDRIKLLEDICKLIKSCRKTPAAFFVNI